ncbi:MAG: hypothetical protein AAGK14_01935 [Verrucomicrobiota bacterium]
MKIKPLRLILALFLYFLIVTTLNIILTSVLFGLAISDTLDIDRVLAYHFWISILFMILSVKFSYDLAFKRSAPGVKSSRPPSLE